MPVLLADPPGELVFVYGTYRRSASNRERMKGATFVSQAMVRGRLLKIGWFPALVLEPEAETWVWGDVFRAEGRQLDAFHEYEGLAGEAVEGKDCRLAEVRVHPYSGAEWGWDVRLWEWTGPVENAEWISSGDWVDYECPKSPPLFTLIACGCAGAVPLGVIAAYFQRHGPLGGASVIMALLAPFAGWFAFCFARRRRERWEPLLMLTSVALFIESVPAVIAVGALVIAYIQHWL